jgi:hypothetical protein
MNHQEAKQTKNSGGHFATGGIPEIEDLVQRQDVMPNPKNRELILRDVLRRIHALVMFA